MQYGRDGIKEITSNLSTQFFGKTNDPETSRFYEGYFGQIKEKTKSVSYRGGGNIFSTTSGRTESEKDVSQVKAIEFFKLKAGQFAFLSDGIGEVVQFRKNNIQKEEIDFAINSVNEKYLRNYDEIIKQTNRIINANVL